MNLKMYENVGKKKKKKKKINFTMIVSVFLSINMDMVLKCKLGHLVPMVFPKFKQIIFHQSDYRLIVECLRNLET